MKLDCRPLGLALMLACPAPPEGETVNGLRTWETTETSNGQAVVQVEVPIQSGETGFILTAESSKILALEYVYAPNGSTILDWEQWDDKNSLTGAVWAEDTDMVFNWPVRSEDGPIDEGTWVVELVTVNGNGNYVGGHDVDVTVQVKTDDDLTTGSVSAMVVFADGVGDQTDVVASTELAVARWVEIWANYGLELEVTYYDSEIDADLSTPGEGGDRDMFEVSAAGEEHDVTVLIGESIDGSIDYYGIAGSIPGTMLATDRSGVVVSWLANAGGDGSFSEDDIRLYGETLAHEIGHYMGLYHLCGKRLFLLGCAR